MRHPKGARSLGIGHPQSGDRCAETRPYPIDPLGSPSSPPPTTPSGCRSHQSVNQCDTLAGSYILFASSVPGVDGTSCLHTRLKKARIPLELRACGIGRQ